MKIGISSYCFHRNFISGAMSLDDLIDWVSASPAEHLELAVVPNAPLVSPEMSADDIASVRRRANDGNVELSGLAVGADLSLADDGEREREIQRICQYVDLAAELGIPRLRHDVVPHAGHSGDDLPLFEEVLPRIVSACKEVTTYAAARGVVTCLENHGRFVQSSHRVRRIVHAVDDPNFGTLLDIGNFVGVDEDPYVGVFENLPYAVGIHLKDFYVRSEDPGGHWGRTRAGRYIRAAIFGQGDIDTRGIISLIKESGFDGYVSLEFEGWEDIDRACNAGLEHAFNLLGQEPSR